MKTRPDISPALYLLLVVLTLVALWLVATAPADFMNVGVVYQGF
jgi:hypothetical protein